MILTGWLLWIGMSILTTAVANAIFRFSWFDVDSKAVKNVKVAIVMAISIVIAVSYVLINKTVAIFGLWGITIYPIMDAVASGIIISFGADFVYQIYQTIVNFKDKLNAQKEVAKATAEKIRAD